ncbi:hypothetical protein [Natrinema sp. 1APR25-10V2]|uniref:hypothetical protein n=1 Tax=Natrinema sp. 1APR25-10V2 TaxID=2951081 RepID=UPI0028763114|nr:hypothetical protein [Natrinema sp. 1APR25-10V2]MDS0474146.1 hypothetical protein [Natrinema sp. 1APR25-10V2]
MRFTTLEFGRFGGLDNGDPRLDEVGAETVGGSIIHRDSTGRILRHSDANLEYFSCGTTRCAEDVNGIIGRVDYRRFLDTNARGIRDWERTIDSFYSLTVRDSFSRLTVATSSSATD